MPNLTFDIPTGLENALADQSKLTGDPVNVLVIKALSSFLNVPLHTLFQISTSGALVDGIYDGVVSSKLLLQYGNFGLGTFEHLDGEMVILDGTVFQVRADGTVRQVPEDSRTPFAVVVNFSSDRDEAIERVGDLQELIRKCDRYRDSQNIFYAFRIDGRFDQIHTRAMRATSNNLPLAKAAAEQPEFLFKDVEGTLVGIWSPAFSSSLNIPGYHFHFLSADRTKGGHLLGCSAEKLLLRVERLNNFHLSLPETEKFLKADLARDASKDLAYAEQVHQRGDK